MEIKIIQDQKHWDDWLVANSETSPFTQSWTWGDILISEGKKVERLAVVENGEIIAQAQVVYSPLFFNWQYVFCPKGPIVDLKFKNKDLRILQLIIEYLKGKNCIFFRVEPGAKLQTSNFRLQKTIDINPSATLILDLTKTEGELLANMHTKTRYNINLAIKKNIEIKQ